MTFRKTALVATLMIAYGNLNSYASELSMTDYLDKAATATCVTTSLDASNSNCLTPPIVKTTPYVVKSKHGNRQDEYYWLRDDERKNPEMLAYLQAENAYADAVLQPLKKLENTLFDEIVSRIKQDDSTVPQRENGYWYYTRYETGKDYPIHARRADAPHLNELTIQAANDRGDFQGEEILLNVNELAQGYDYYSASISDISQDNTKLVWAEDTSGRRQYTLKVKDLVTGQMLAGSVENTSGSAVFVDNGNNFLYIENDKETLLGNKVKRRVVGSTKPQAQDAVVYEEKDDSFYMGISATRDKKYSVIHSSSTVSDEVRYAPINQSNKFTVLAPRQRGLEYSADHHNGRWFIRTNANKAQNFKIVTAPSNATSTKQWRDEIAHNKDVYIDEFELFDDFMAIAERSNGLNRIRIVNKDKKEHYVDANESAYTMALSTNSEPNTQWLRYNYESMTTPDITYNLNVQTGEKVALKQRPVSNYQAENYITERIWVPARDGAKIPVSLVYHKDFKKDGSAALLQYAYGSYGASMDPYFSVSRISLLDRGMVFAIAHIRGGQEMGREWYEQGKMMNKVNTFNDFIDVTRWLTDNGYAAKDRVAAWGGSAGGLLMGAIANMAPKDYRVILSEVPFVDVVTTMLDTSIPLTTNEYDEWGNPANKASYNYMLSYSPYDNIKQQSYPAMYINTGLWDSQVQYWEPAKYVARLRTKNTSAYPVVFRTNMQAGHGGKSGRFDSYRETAELYSFMMNQLGVR